jgi:hypothetical protein
VETCSALFSCSVLTPEKSLYAGLHSAVRVGIDAVRYGRVAL